MIPRAGRVVNPQIAQLAEPEDNNREAFEGHDDVKNTYFAAVVHPDNRYPCRLARNLLGSITSITFISTVLSDERRMATLPTLSP